MNISEVIIAVVTN